MVSNVARLTRSLRDAVLEMDPAPARPAANLAERLRIARRELSQKGESIFIDDRGNRFRIERKPA